MAADPRTNSVPATLLARRPDAPWILGLLFAAAFLLLLFGLLAGEVLEGDTLAFDRRVLLLLHGPADQGYPNGPAWLQEMARDVTALGSFSVLALLTVAVVVFLLIVRQRMFAAFAALAVAGGELVGTALKIAFARGRPDVAAAPPVFTASFPSGHAMLSAVTFLTLGALLTRSRADRQVQLYGLSVAVVLTVLVGASRLYLGLHYASDVLAGWCVGTGWALLCWSAMTWLERRHVAAVAAAPLPSASSAEL